MTGECESAARARREKLIGDFRDLSNDLLEFALHDGAFGCVVTERTRDAVKELRRLYREALEP